MGQQLFIIYVIPLVLPIQIQFNCAIQRKLMTQRSKTCTSLLVYRIEFWIIFVHFQLLGLYQ